VLLVTWRSYRELKMNAILQQHNRDLMLLETLIRTHGEGWRKALSECHPKMDTPLAKLQYRAWVWLEERAAEILA